MQELLQEYLNLLIELKIYPFAPLEVNFVINFVWIVFRSFFKVTSDYRQKAGSILEFKILTFLFSFLIMFLFYLSLDFWTTILKITSTWLMLVPSVLSIFLAEVAGLLAKIFALIGKKEEPEAELAPASIAVMQGAGLEESEEQMIKKTRELSFYVAISFILLALFWGYMVLTYL